MEQGSLAPNPLGEAIALVRSLRDYLVWQESQGWGGIPLSSRPGASFRQQPQVLKAPAAIDVARQQARPPKKADPPHSSEQHHRSQGFSSSLSAAFETAQTSQRPPETQQALPQKQPAPTPRREEERRSTLSTSHFEQEVHHEDLIYPLQRSLLRELPPSRIDAIQHELDAIHKALPVCQACQGPCQSQVLGHGPVNARVMWIYEGPNVEEDLKGIPFQGKAGRLLEGMMRSIGLRRDEAYITPIMTCRPLLEDTDESWGKFNPTEEQIQDYVPALFQKIQAIQPDLIVTLGVVPTQLLRRTKEKFRHLHGHLAKATIGDREYKVFSMLHPSYLCRNPKAKPHAWMDLLVFLKELTQLLGS